MVVDNKTIYDLEKPAGLSTKGQEAWKAIMKVLIANDAYFTGGCKTFYSPAEWTGGGRSYCENSELVVVYDGGSVAPFFEYDYECYDAVGKMKKALADVGLYFEPATNCIAGIYEI